MIDHQSIRQKLEILSRNISTRFSRQIKQFICVSLTAFLFTIYSLGFSYHVVAQTLVPFIDYQAQQHLTVVDDALLEEEEKLLRAISGESVQKQSQSSVAYSVKPSVTRYQQEAETVARLRAQQAELDALLDDFRYVEKQSEKLDELLDNAEKVANRPKKSVVTAVAINENPTEDFATQKSHSVHALPITRPREVNTYLQFGKTEITPPMPIAEVQSVTAELLSGPGPDFPTVFRARQGATVAVTKRYEDWYLVVHSTGMKGWVKAQELLFGEDYRSLPGKLVRVAAYDISSDRTDWEEASSERLITQ